MSVPPPYSRSGRSAGLTLWPASSPAAHHDDCKARAPGGKGPPPGLACLGPTSPGPSAGRARGSLSRLPSALPSLRRTTTRNIVVMQKPLRLRTPSALPAFPQTSLAWQRVYSSCPFLEPSSPFTTTRHSHPALSALTRVAVTGSGSRSAPGCLHRVLGSLLELTLPLGTGYRGSQPPPGTSAFPL